jgi:hypothetical protein
MLDRQINVGVDVWGYAPAPEHEIAALLARSRFAPAGNRPSAQRPASGATAAQA